MNSLPLIPGYKIIDNLGRGRIADVYLGIQEKLEHLQESLSRRLKNRGPSQSHVLLEVVGDVAAALVYTHDNDILYHDIKPGNITFRRDGSVVAGFGIARAMGSVTQLTQTGTSVGKKKMWQFPAVKMGVVALQPAARVYFAVKGKSEHKTVPDELGSGKPLYIRMCFDDNVEPHQDESVLRRINLERTKHRLRKHQK
jgi:hypothetical protein